jgi:hypothetical protein
MANLVLDGKEITFDWSKVKHKDCIQFYADKMTAEEESAFFVKVCGLTLDAINEFIHDDWKRFAVAMRRSYFAPTQTVDEKETEKN